MLQSVLLLHTVLAFMCCVSSGSRMWPYAVQGLHGSDVNYNDSITSKLINFNM